jgi:hypothetical protein
LVDLLRVLYYRFPFTYYKTDKKSKLTKKVSKKQSKRIKITKMLNISKKKMKMVRALALSLDIDFGYYSYDKLRNLFTTMVTNDQYPIPQDGVALLEYKRILSQGMSTLVGKINQNIINNPSLLLSKFEVEDKNELSNNPIFISIHNTIMKS